MSVGEERSGAAEGRSVGRRHRRWSDAQKRQIVAETHEPIVSAPMVAQRCNLNANQIFRWRRPFREPERAGGAGRFVSVVVEGAPVHEVGGATMSPQSRDDDVVGARATGRMEIVLPDDHRRVIVDRTVDGQALVRETFEVIPRRWKVIQTVQEKLTCGEREAMSQPPAPFHATTRGRARPSGEPITWRGRSRREPEIASEPLLQTVCQTAAEAWRDMRASPGRESIP